MVDSRLSREILVPFWELGDCHSIYNCLIYCWIASCDRIRRSNGSRESTFAHLVFKGWATAERTVLGLPDRCQETD